MLNVWLKIVAGVAFLNAVKSYTSTFTLRKIFGEKKGADDLASHLFGTWTFLSAAIRWLAASNLQNQVAYDLCLFSFILAFVFFFMEWQYFKSAKLALPLISPIAVSGVSIIWMISQRNYYL